LKNLVLFDGQCALCQGTVRLLVDLDRRGRLHFAPLEGPTSTALRARHSTFPASLRSMVFVENWDSPGEAVWLESDAALRAGAALGGIYRLLGWVRVVPAAWRNAAYRWVAANRYQWFGRSAACSLMPPELRTRMLP
jgi:predicted DCC family thiol-disulfide oxidoreductase YuxK